jgi:hypothetical protein
MNGARLVWIGLTGIVVVIAMALAFGGDVPAPTTRPTPTATADPLSAGTFFLEITQPAETEVVVISPAFRVAGRTRADAVVSINDVLVEQGVDGRFSLDLVLDEGPAVIEAVASIATGAQLDEVLTVIFAP